MNAILEAEAHRDLIINNVCKPCAAKAEHKECINCMDWYTLRVLDNVIDEAADAEAERRGM